MKYTIPADKPKEDPVDPGRYIAKFLGAEEKQYNFGQGEQTRLRWSFQIEGGEFDKRFVSCLSGLEPVKKSNMLKFLEYLSGNFNLGEGDVVDIEDYVGRMYRVKLKWNESQTYTNVCEFEEVDEDGRPIEREPRISSTGKSGVQPGTNVPLYYVEIEGKDEPVEMTRSEVGTHLQANNLDPEQVMLCVKGGPPKYKPASEFGFTNEFEF